MKSIFLELIAGFCRLKLIDNNGTLAAGAPLKVNGASCSLIYNETLAQDVVFLHVVYDYVPVESEAIFSKNLVCANDASSDEHTLACCQAPAMGSIGQITQLRLSELTPTLLESELVWYTQRLALWRDKELSGKLGNNARQPLSELVVQRRHG